MGLQRVGTVEQLNTAHMLIETLSVWKYRGPVLHNSFLIKEDFFPRIPPTQFPPPSLKKKKKIKISFKNSSHAYI